MLRIQNGENEKVSERKMEKLKIQHKTLEEQMITKSM